MSPFKHTTLPQPSPDIARLRSLCQHDRRIYHQLAMLLGAIEDMQVTSVRPWASMTFSGERHCLRFRLRDCPDLHNRLAELPEHEFRLAGAIVADCCVTSKDPVLVQDVEGFYRAVDVDIELLTISDPQAEQPL